MSRGPAVGSAAVQHSRHFNQDLELRRRREIVVARKPSTRSHVEGVGIPFKPRRRPAARTTALKVLEHSLLQISAALLLAGAFGWCWLIYCEFRSSVLVAAAPVAAYSGVAEVESSFGKSDAINTSSYARIDQPEAPSGLSRKLAAVDYASSLGAPQRKSGFATDGEPAASIVARDFSVFQPAREIDRGRTPAKEAKNKTPPVRVAALENAAPIAALRPTPDDLGPMNPNIAAKTSLVDFETAPFPYHGDLPGSNRRFLNAGDEDRRGHVNFRGRVLWESGTFSDDRVLLHIPPGFDPTRPAVMMVFFHGHGATLARDVRDRQRVPAQITEAGVNAVLVAPQFAVDAADSSAGKFWERNGFKRFLDEAATKLARLYDEPRSALAFANMPIVLVAYSGGFGPTLSVLDHGGARSRIRGLVLLDALYGGIDQFADWIANNRSTFFVSSYTTHTAHHNAYLEHLLRERSVPYGTELRRDHLQGMVTFLAAGDISHRDFVNHAWADNPIKDILARVDDVDPNLQTAATSPSTASAWLAASGHN